MGLHEKELTFREFLFDKNQAQFLSVHVTAVAINCGNVSRQINWNLHSKQKTVGLGLKFC